MFDRDGPDAMRWFLMASPILRGSNLIVTGRGHPVKGVRQVLLPLWNAYSFLALCAEEWDLADRFDPRAGPLHSLAKLAVLRDDLTGAMDVCDLRCL